jgi:hypothetical protein
MVEFIERDSKRRVAVNPAHVVAAKPAPGGTLLLFQHDQVVVEGTYTEVTQALGAA